MSKLCERPGCSEPGAAVYGMVPEDLLFWITATDTSTPPDAKLLCRRHADAMVVPRGWTLDDRRQSTPSLFQTRRYDSKPPSSGAPTALPATASPRRQVRHAADQAVEQLQIDGTGPIPRPVIPEEAAVDSLPEATTESLAEPVFEPLVAPAEPDVHVVDESDVLDEPEVVDEPDVLDEPEVRDESDVVDEPDSVIEPDVEEADDPVVDGTGFNAWRPEFELDDDLDGLLETKSPLLSRAFRGTARQR